MKKNLDRLYGERQSHLNTTRFRRYTGGNRFWLLPVLLCVLLIFAAFKNSHAQDTPNSTQSDPIVPIGTEYQNSIKFLNNRFRVDGDVQEVTMIFFREQGSAPIVLVRPDGSKLSLALGKETPGLRWYETDTYDMITLSKPMPGPWQAVGQILPNSKVMVITDISLDAQPIPTPVYSGEVIKQTATLLNDGKPVNLTEFRDVVRLNIDFISTNNPNYENFGLGGSRVARFEDDGTGYDEYAADGIFTGQFELTIPPGEWQPVFSINTPLFSREQINDVILLLPNPVITRVKLDESGEGDHIISVDVDRSQIDMQSFIFDGTIRYPNGEVDNVSYTYASDEIKTVKVINNEFGTYRFKINAYAQTVDGRDLVLDVPEFSFTTIAPPEPEVVSPEEASANENETPVVVEEEPMSTLEIALWALLVNVVIIVFGGAILFVLSDMKKRPNDHIMLRVKNKILGLIAKVKKKKETDSEEKSDKATAN